MDLTTAQVLITGGSEGIGRGLAARFLAAGSTVLITGRNTDKLSNTASALPGLLTFVNDISTSAAREALAAHVKEVLPGLTIIINNAGIQRRIALAADHADWEEREKEIHTLFSAPVHLNHLLIPILLAKGKPALIVNVTSGGAYVPQVFAPVYSASKAALHSYTMTLRHALAGTLCHVVELIPPAVQTALAGLGQQHGADLDVFCDHIFKQLTTTDNNTIGYGMTENIIPQISGKAVEEFFNASAERFPIEKYS